MEIVIIRHGESVNNQEDTSLHTADPDLSPRGFLQARLLGERMAKTKIDALFASPLCRALRTANEISVRKDGMPVQILHELVEIGTEPGDAGNYGDGYTLDVNDPYYSLSRAYRVISRIRQSFPDDARVVLVAHGAFNQRLIAAALRTPLPSDDWVFSQDNTGVSVVSWRPNREGRIITRLIKMNDTSHLYGAGMTE